MQNTITLNQAAQRAHTYLHQVSAALPGKPRLAPNAGGITELACTDPSDNGPQGRVSVGGSYFLQDIHPERYPEIFDFFHHYLAQQGFTVHFQKSYILVMENPKDGFRVGLQEGGDEASKGLSLIVSSPCVWPNGTPPPQ